MLTSSNRKTLAAADNCCDHKTLTKWESSTFQRNKLYKTLVSTFLAWIFISIFWFLHFIAEWETRWRIRFYQQLLLIRFLRNSRWQSTKKKSLRQKRKRREQRRNRNNSEEKIFVSMSAATELGRDSICFSFFNYVMNAGNSYFFAFFIIAMIFNSKKLTWCNKNMISFSILRNLILVLLPLSCCLHKLSGYSEEFEART